MMHIINDETPIEVADSTSHAKGLIPRDYEAFPQGCYKSATAFDMPLIPRSEWAERIREMEATKTRLSDLRRALGIKSLDQNGVGYCWNHSITMCVIMLRAVMGLPYVRLSAFMVGCLIKNYRNEGGWSALALDFIQEHGIPSVEFWPEKSMKRSNDTPEMRANAKLHIVTEGWADLSASVYDRNFTEDQAMTLLLTRNPVGGDFNWWGHAICLMDPVIMNAAVAMTTDLGSLDFNNPKDLGVYAESFGKRFINSWTDDWGENGEGVLTGRRALLNGGVAPRVTNPSAA